ncbi:MAG: PAS domain-containing protein [Deltaproteobacteria bacterium]|nr:PAS domain-containing protein [Deltaproteobacteria bacterium]
MSDLKGAIVMAEAVANLFRPFVEVVVHDIEKSRIVAIFNNTSRRSVGDDSMIEDAAGLHEGPDIHGPFEQRTFDGRRLKYTSVVLRNEAGRAVGLMCINADVSPLEKMEEAIGALLRPAGDSAALDSHFRDDWQERIRSFVQEYSTRQETTIARMTRRERAELVTALHEAGAFRAKNAAGFIANVLGVSRATVYNDLGEAKAKTVTESPREPG